MAIRVAVNGYGRIGRLAIRALFETARDDIELVAVNSSLQLDAITDSVSDPDAVLMK